MVDETPVNVSSGSQSLSLNKNDWLKIGKGSLIAGAGFAIVVIPETLKLWDFGKYTPLMVAVAAVAVNMISKFLANNQ
jgi:hypothetical protein